MSIKIHHGFPGSYKTSGAVQDDFIPAVTAGRHVITNVRGLDDEDNIRDVLEKAGFVIPASFRLTWVDTSTSDGMDMIRKWFHWIPDGAFLLLDEIQEIYPRSMRDSQLNSFRFPGGIDAASAAGTFETLALAFEKHRHKNLDFVVTTPHIQKVHPVVRGAAEGGYKHKNLAVLGSLFKGRYIEGFHPVDTNGKPSDFYSVIRKSIKPYVFDLYKSTATGKATDTTAGQSIFANPKVLGLLFIVVALIAGLFFAPTPHFLQNKPTSDVPGVSPSAPVASPSNSVGAGANNDLGVGNVPPVVRSALPVYLKFLEWSPQVLSAGGTSLHPVYSLRYTRNDGYYFDLDQNNANGLGLVVSVKSSCLAVVHYKGESVSAAFCPPSPVPGGGTDNIDIASTAIDSGVSGAKSLNPLSPPR